MTIDSREALRSFHREAGRQADFFATRHKELFSMWAEIESHLTIALSEGKSITLHITEGKELHHPHIIKHGEQGQQLQKPLTNKE